MTCAPLPAEPSVAYPDGSTVRAVRTMSGVVARGVFLPGHRWSRDVRPIEGTELCEVPHLGLALEGRMLVTMADGATAEFGAGDVFDIPAGHDAEIVSDEPFVCVAFRT